MSADMKAATEIAERNRYANTTFGDLSNAFLELAEESRRWENVFDAQTSELRELRQRAAELQELFHDSQRRRLEHEDTIGQLTRRAADLQARLDRVEAETIERCRMICSNGAKHARACNKFEAAGAADMLAEQIRALAAAGGQESAATECTCLTSESLCEYCRKKLSAADSALPGLEILASHSGKSQNREWHSVGTWLYPGEAIYEGTPK